MSFISSHKLSELELFELREKCLSEFKEFKKEYSQFFIYYNKIHESFYGELEDINFICNVPKDCDIVIMYQKLKKISDSLIDFRNFVES
jgi:hypothetical protein